MYRTLAVLAAVGCALAVAGLAVPVAAHANHVAADPQTTPDGTIVVESAFILDDGFLAVQRDDGGDPGTVVGHAALSGNDGFLTDVEIEIDDDVWVEWDSPKRVHLVLRSDDGDGNFDPDDDRVVRSFGSAAAAMTTIDRGGRAVVTARRFSPQPVKDGSVTVRRAALPADGYLVVENASDGRVLGTASLEGGDHTNVTVPLDGTLGSADSVGVRAVLYRDDGNGEFDGADEPFAVSGEPVATRFSLKPGAAANGTVTPTPDLVTTATPFSDDSATPTATAARTTDPTATGGQPGFGPLVTLAGGGAALAALLAIRRRET